MSDEQAGAAAPTNEPASTAPAVAEQATPTDGIRDVDAAPENAETPEQEQPVTDAAQEEAKRLSRSQRYQRKISAQAGVIERTETENQKLRRENEELKKAKATDAAPNPADFPNGEWDSGYISKLAEHNTLKAVNARLGDLEKRSEQERKSEVERTVSQKLGESAAKARERIADYDETLKAFVDDGGVLAPHVDAAIHALGDKAAVVAYNLAKDPDLVDRLNAMSPMEAVLEIGELRAKASLPQSKTQTKMPPPHTTVRGGAAAFQSLADHAKSDDATGYWDARKKGVA